MPDVDPDVRIIPDAFEAPVQLYGRKTPRQGVALLRGFGQKSQHRGQRGRGIGELVRAPQRRPRQFQRDVTLPEYHVRIPGLDREVPAQQRKRGPGSVGRIQDTAGRFGLAANQRAFRPDDPGLFAADLFDVVAEVFLVVQADRRNHGAIRVEQVDRVQASAQPDFHHGEIQVLLGQQLESGQRSELEVAQADIVERRFDCFERFDQRLVGSRLAVDLDALVVVVDVRRGVAAEAVAQPAQEAAYIRDRRAFAVGARHDEDASGRSRRTHAEPDLAAAVQPEVDGSVVPVLDQLQPITERGRQAWGIHRWFRK